MSLKATDAMFVLSPDAVKTEPACYGSQQWH